MLAFMAGLKVVFISQSGLKRKAPELHQDPLSYHRDLI
jgi:hypothetical protein